eukprot:COSAG02_NODE_1080_length_14710_cov_46.078913_15_plen_129_part_00
MSVSAEPLATGGREQNKACHCVSTFITLPLSSERLLRLLAKMDAVGQSYDRQRSWEQSLLLRSILLFPPDTRKTDSAPPRGRQPWVSQRSLIVSSDASSFERLAPSTSQKQTSQMINGYSRYTDKLYG